LNTLVRQTLALSLCTATLLPQSLFGQNSNVAAPSSPRIESIVPSAKQPRASDPNVIWYDDFDDPKGPSRPYTESSGGVDGNVAFGGAGASMLCVYEKGQQGKGNRKVFFGDSPTGKVVRKGEVFQDVYWRIYVRHEPNWTGGSPAKMSRATSIVSPRWNQAMIAHVWGGAGEVLTLDPASGVRGGQVVTTKYNDFDNLHWLGNKPAAKFPISSAAEAGWWVCVESRARLNAPGQKDGLNQLWIDSRLEAERKNLDWRGSYNGHGINAVFLEAYWNQGSPVTQRRWYDNFIISAAPIGPVVCSANPVLIKTPYRGAGAQAAWEAHLASDAEGKAVVWQSHLQGKDDRLTVSDTTGAFVGELAGRKSLAAGKTYYVRARQKSDAGLWSNWSPWHQGFAVAPGE
jgi:hypothetical protein